MKDINNSKQSKNQARYIKVSCLTARSNKVKNRFFYGYWVVLAGFVTCALNAGLGFYAFSVLNKTIGDDFDWSRSQVTAAFLIYSITLALASFSAGRLTDKRGPRQVLLAPMARNISSHFPSKNSAWRSSLG